MAITPLPPAPQPGDSPQDFNTKAFALVDSLDTFVTEANQLASDVNDDAEAAALSAGQSANSADESANSAAISQSSANFKGVWSELSGAANVPYSVFHDGRFWMLLRNIANVSASEPGDTLDWQEIVTQEIVRTPVAIEPLSGATGVVPSPLLDASGYQNIYESDTRDYRIFQVDTAAGDFSSPVYEFQDDVDSHTVADTLSFDTSYKWRCRDVANSGAVSLWMSTQEFTTGSISIAQPTLTVEGSPSSVPETPQLSTSAFSVVGGSDTHLNTDWQILDDQLNVVWESLADASNKTSITVPAGELSTNTTYTFRARHRGTVYGVSAWGSVIATTQSSFNNFIATPAATPSNFGDSFEGGFYAGLIWNQVTQSATSTAIGTGSKTFTVTDAAPLFYSGQTVEVRSRANPATNRMIGTVTGSAGTTLTVNVTSVDGSGTYTDWSIMARYRVIVAPKSSGDDAGKQWKNANTAAPSATGTLTEGYKSTMAMVAADTSTVYPAAHWANDLTINTYSDWYVPARDELELCWRNLKPATDNNYTSTDRPTGATNDYKNLGSLGDTANTHGLNNNSSPQGAAYTTTVPARTSASAFQTGGAEAFTYGSAYYWSSTEYSASVAWLQFWNSSYPGYQGNYVGKSNAHRVRAVRRSII